MECSEFKKKLADFAAGDLSLNDNEECLDHIKHCKECLDELEIYCIVEYGIKNNINTGPFVLEDYLRAINERVNEKIVRSRRIDIFRKVLNVFIHGVILILVIILMTLLL